LALPRFNPRLPGGRRRKRRRGCCTTQPVSIHAFRGEGDRVTRSTTASPWTSFNPRLPGGRRRGLRAVITTTRVFQSTPSGGKATARVGISGSDSAVSIHAFRGEGDGRGGLQRDGTGDVSIHAFRGEGDGRRSKALRRRCGFNPRLPGGRRRHHAPF